MKRWLGVFGVVVAWSVWGGVFDDAAAWWTFDQGGVDGAVATKAEIHDARNPSQNQPTALYGAQGGPVWSVLDVRLPHQKRTVRGTALRFPCETRMKIYVPSWIKSGRKASPILSSTVDGTSRRAFRGMSRWA